MIFYSFLFDVILLTIVPQSCDNCNVCVSAGYFASGIGKEGRFVAASANDFGGAKLHFPLVIII